MDKLWLKIRKTRSCWIWEGARDKDGYGLAWVEGKVQRVHRYIYKQLVGPIPKGLMVCHHCDRTFCCRPECLFLGTAQDNTNDAMAKGRLKVVGRKNPKAKLNITRVKKIRKKYATGKYGQKQIAQEFGIHESSVSDIVRNKTWRQA